MMPRHEHTLSLTELSFQKLDLTKRGCFFVVFMRIYCIHKKNSDKILVLMWTRAGGRDVQQDEG